MPAATVRTRPSPWPLTITALALAAVVAYSLLLVGGDTRLALLPGRDFAPPGLPTIPRNAKGYDGQFGLYMALYPPPEVARYLDVPAYRYQRVLLPALAGLLSQGDARAYAWAAWAVLAAGHLLGVAVVQGWLRQWGRDQTWALVYGLWPGFILAFRVGLPEPLSYGLAWAGLEAGRRGKTAWAWLLFLLAVLAKETALVVVAAAVLAWLRSHPRRALRLALGVGLPWLAWQAVLVGLFGRPGVGSGGAGATGWSWLPLGWLAQLAAASPKALFLFLVVMGPALLWPVLLAAWYSLQEWRGCRGWRATCPDLWVWLLTLHALVALLLPFSTWREPFAVIRVLSGPLAAFWFYSWHRRRLWGWRLMLAYWMGLWVFALGRI